MQFNVLDPNIEWYYVSFQGERIGPITFHEFKKKWDEKQLDLETYCWNENMENWQPISSLSDLKNILVPQRKKKIKQHNENVALEEKLSIDVGVLPANVADIIQSVKKEVLVSNNNNINNSDHHYQIEGIHDPTIQLKGVAVLPSIHDGNKPILRHVENIPNNKKFVNQNIVPQYQRGTEWVWVPHPIEVYVPSRIIRKEDNVSIVEYDNESMQVLTNSTIKLNYDTLSKDYSNIVNIEPLSFPHVLYLLRERFKTNQIYTYLSDMLIVINPWQPLNIFSLDTIHYYQHTPDIEPPPHVFAIASHTYQNLFEKELDQSILVSGISGSGKTEVTKQCIMYLTEIAGCIEIDQKLLATSPALECFGNAKTQSNLNASRFCRYLSIHFNSNGKIIGASTKTFLFDKPRLINYSDGERNYHVFYALCDGAPQELKQSLHLENSSKYKILNLGRCTSIQGINETTEFETLNKALNFLGISNNSQNNIWQTLASILHFGNISFLDTIDGKCVIENESFLLEASRFLSVDPKLLRSYLTTRVIRVPPQSVSVINLSSIDANINLGSIVQYLYHHVFQWILKQLNSILLPNVSDIFHSITIADVRFFENHQQNSLEEFCNNFSNEKIQQFYFQHVFKKEFRLYQAEDIPFDKVDFSDNNPILDIFEAVPIGIMFMIDDETKNPNGSDSTFLDRVRNANLNTRFFSSHPLDTSFSITHYQQLIRYNANGFILKNKRNTFNEELFNIFRTSKWKFLQELLSFDKSSNKLSMCQEILDDLQSFSQKLNQTQPHFITCINPNSDKRSLVFISSFVDTQFKYFSVYETAEVRKTGFPYRLLHHDFLTRYKCCSNRIFSEDLKVACVELVQDMNLNPLDIRIGRDSVFYPHHQYILMEKLRKRFLDANIRIIQSFVRSRFAIHLLQKMKKITPILRSAIQNQSIEALKIALSQAETLKISFPMFLLSQAKILLKVLTERQRIEKELREILSKDPETCFEEYQKVIAAADACSLNTELLNQLRSKFEDVRSRRQLSIDLQEGLAEADENKLRFVLTKSMQLGQITDSNVDLLTAQAMLQRINQEKPLIAKLYQSIDTFGWLKNGDIINIDYLKQALIEAQSFGMRTKEGRRLEALGTILFNLRQKLKCALPTENRLLWQDVENTAKIGSENFPDHPEIKAALAKSSLFTTVANVNDQLNSGIQNLDHQILQNNLEKAKQLNMNPQEYPLIHIATKYLIRMQEARQLLQNAKEPLNQEKLEYALAYADSFNYNTTEVKEDRDLLTTIVQLNNNISEALRILEPEEMKHVLNVADALKLKNENVEVIRNLLYNTSEEKFVQLQLKAAVASNDTARVTRVTIRLKTLFFATKGDLFRFDLFPNLRTPTEFAEAKYFGLSFSKDELAHGFLNYTTKPIHTSLTRLDSDATKVAIKLFKNILGFMNEQNYGLAREIIAMCLQSFELRDEVYCQVIKQLTQNPSLESRERAWHLMFLFLQVFPPGDQLENYLEMWLRTNAQPFDRFVTALHRTVYEGAAQLPPTQEEILALISGKTLETKNNMSIQTTVQSIDSQPISQQKQELDSKFSNEQLLQQQIEYQKYQIAQQQKLIQQQQQQQQQLQFQKEQHSIPIKLPTQSIILDQPIISQERKFSSKNNINPNNSNSIPSSQPFSINSSSSASFQSKPSMAFQSHQTLPSSHQTLPSSTFSNIPVKPLNNYSATSYSPMKNTNTSDPIPKTSFSSSLYPSVPIVSIHSYSDQNQDDSTTGETNSGSTDSYTLPSSLKCCFATCNNAREFGPYCSHHVAVNTTSDNKKQGTCVWKKIKNSRNEVFYLNSDTLETTFSQPTDYF